MAKKHNQILEIKSLMLRTGINLVGLAHITGYSYETVRHWVSDMKIPDHVMTALRKHANAVDDVWNNEDRHAHLR